MAKKGQVSQLQVEVSSEDDWEKLLQREGLIVVDVYSEWCGPCSGMSANLKKIKLEIGGDNLHLAMAKADHIKVLERFRGKSEPTWMFIMNHKMTNLMFGPDAPRLQRLITEELKQAQAVRDGAIPRQLFELTDLAPEELERAESIDKERLEGEKKEKEAVEKAYLERATETMNNITREFSRHGFILALPSCRDMIITFLSDQWEKENLFLHRQEKVKVTKENVQELKYFSKDNLPDELADYIVDKQCLAMTIETQEGFFGDVYDRIRLWCFGPSKTAPGSPDGLNIRIKEALILAKIEKAQAVKALEAMERVSSIKQKESTVIAAEVAEVEEMVEEEEEEVVPKEPDLDEGPIEMPIDDLDLGLGIGKEDAVEEEQMPEEEEEKEIDWQIWTPHDKYSTANAMKVFFQRLTEHYVVPEPPPIPDHIAVSFDAFKRSEVLDIINQYPEDVMRYGFFTSEVPEEAKLIAKTAPKFEQTAKETKYGEKLVIQLMKKHSETLLAFAQMGPTYMSSNSADGRRECSLFFPEGYDEILEEVPVAKKKRKKGKKPSITAAPTDVTGEEMPIIEETGSAELDLEVDGEALPEGEEGVIPEEGMAYQLPEGAEGLMEEEMYVEGEGQPPPEGPIAETEAPPPTEGAPPAEGEPPADAARLSQASKRASRASQARVSQAPAPVEGAPPAEAPPGETPPPAEGAPPAEAPAPAEGAPAEAPPAEAPPAEAPPAEAPPAEAPPAETPPADAPPAEAPPAEAPPADAPPADAPPPEEPPAEAPPAEAPPSEPPAPEEAAPPEG